MIKSKITKNGMINFPAKLRKKMNIDIGDEVAFVETDEGVLVLPVISILNETNPDEMPLAIQLIKDLISEHRNES